MVYAQPRRTRVDGNQRACKRAMEQMGAVVKLTTTVPGFVDAVVGFMGMTVLMEIKTDRGDLTEAEEEFWEFWPGGPLRLVRSPDEAVQVLLALSRLWPDHVGRQAPKQSAKSVLPRRRRAHSGSEVRVHQR